jgi:hypothetical protein
MLGARGGSGFEHMRRYAKTSRIPLAIAASLFLSSCAWNPGFLPAFGGWEYGALTQFVDFVDIDHDVQCEVQDFLHDTTLRPAGGFEVPSAELAKGLLASDQPATVTLTLQTDLSGKATATGVNLSKVGLNFLADTITLANKTPTLQANLLAKGSVSAAPVSSIPQTYDDLWKIYVYDKDGKIEQKPFYLPKEDPRDAKDAEAYIRNNLHNIKIVPNGTYNIPLPTEVKFPSNPLIKGLGRTLIALSQVCLNVVSSPG